MKAVYSTNEVAEITEVSLRQLQWWDEQYIVTARIHQHARCYTPMDVLQVFIVGELRSRGLSLQAIVGRGLLSAVMRELRKIIGQGDTLSYSGPELLLLTDAVSFSLKRGAGEAIEALKLYRSGMHCVSISDAIQRIARAK